MRITDSATKRGVAVDDILHALDNYVRVFTDQGDAELSMFIGPARDGSMLEIGVIEDDEPRYPRHAHPTQVLALTGGDKDDHETHDQRCRRPRTIRGRDRPRHRDRS